MKTVFDKALLSILLITFTAHLNMAHGQCKWDVNKKDKFSGKKILASKKLWSYQEVIKGTYSDNCYLEIGCEDSIPKLHVWYLIEPALTNGAVINTVSLSFRLENDEVLELTQSKNVTAGVVCCYGTNIEFTVELTKEQVNAFSKSKIIGAKFTAGEYENAFELKNKAVKKIMKYFGCLLTEIK